MKIEHNFKRNYKSYSFMADFLGWKKSTLYSKVSRKEIPHIRVNGRNVMFDLNEINEWLDAKRVPVMDKKANETGREND